MAESKIRLTGDAASVKAALAEMVASYQKAEVELCASADRIAKKYRDIPTPPSPTGKGGPGGASGEVREILAGIEKLGSGTAIQPILGMVEKLGSALTGIGSAVAVAGLTAEMMHLGGEAQKDERAFRILDSTLAQVGATGAGVRDVIGGTIEKLAGMGVATQGELAKMATQLAGARVPAEDMGKAMEMAFRVAELKGISMESVIRRATRAMSDMPESLRGEKILENLTKQSAGAPALEDLKDTAREATVAVKEAESEIGKLFLPMKTGADIMSKGIADVISDAAKELVRERDRFLLAVSAPSQTPAEMAAAKGLKEAEKAARAADDAIKEALRSYADFASKKGFKQELANQERAHVFEGTLQEAEFQAGQSRDKTIVSAAERINRGEIDRYTDPMARMRANQELNEAGATESLGQIVDTQRNKESTVAFEQTHLEQLRFQQDALIGKTYGPAIEKQQNAADEARLNMLKARGGVTNVDERITTGVANFNALAQAQGDGHNYTADEIKAAAVQMKGGSQLEVIAAQRAAQKGSIGGTLKEAWSQTGDAIAGLITGTSFQNQSSKDNQFRQVLVERERKDAVAGALGVMGGNTGALKALQSPAGEFGANLLTGGLYGVGRYGKDAIQSITGGGEVSQQAKTAQSVARDVMSASEEKSLSQSRVAQAESELRAANERLAVVKVNSGDFRLQARRKLGAGEELGAGETRDEEGYARRDIKSETDKRAGEELAYRARQGNEPRLVTKDLTSGGTEIAQLQAKISAQEEKVAKLKNEADKGLIEMSAKGFGVQVDAIAKNIQEAQKAEKAFEQIESKRLERVQSSAQEEIGLRESAAEKGLQADLKGTLDLSKQRALKYDISAGKESATREKLAGMEDQKSVLEAKLRINPDDEGIKAELESLRQKMAAEKVTLYYSVREEEDASAGKHKEDLHLMSGEDRAKARRADRQSRTQQNRKDAYEDAALGELERTGAFQNQDLFGNGKGGAELGRANDPKNRAEARRAAVAADGDMAKFREIFDKEIDARDDVKSATNVAKAAKAAEQKRINRRGTELVLDDKDAAATIESLPADQRAAAKRADTNFRSMYQGDIAKARAGDEEAQSRLGEQYAKNNPLARIGENQRAATAAKNAEQEKLGKLSGNDAAFTEKLVKDAKDRAVQGQAAGPGADAVKALHAAVDKLPSKEKDKALQEDAEFRKKHAADIANANNEKLSPEQRQKAKDDLERAYRREAPDAAKAGADKAAQDIQDAQKAAKDAADKAADQNGKLNAKDVTINGQKITFQGVQMTFNPTINVNVDGDGNAGYEVEPLSPILDAQ